MKALNLLKSQKERKTFNSQELDNAIKELEDLQNRSCYSCKYILDTETEGNFCEYNDRCSDEGISIDYVRDIKDFCCNRWEIKDKQ